MSTRKRDIRIKRVYEPASSDDGARLLVDRLWPRGLKKENASLTIWLRDAAPSDALRRWFGHDPTRWREFVRRYHAELANNGDVVAQLMGLVGKGRVTLVYAAHDEEHNNAAALAAWLQNQGKAARSQREA